MASLLKAYSKLKSVLPQPAKHILDWLHIAMKLRPIEQTSKWLARLLPPDEQEEFLEDIATVRWRLWNGQTQRAIDLIDRLFHDLKADEQGNPVVVPLRGGLLILRTYIEQNRGSIASYGARYREGKRIASTAAEASVNNLVARRMAADALVGKRSKPASSGSRRPCQWRSCRTSRLSAAHSTRADPHFAFRAGAALSACRMTPGS